jgi:hypothetical protein
MRFVGLPLYVIDQERARDHVVVVTTTDHEYHTQHGWKLLNLYKFVPETGEWRHRNHLKYFQRRWLDDISFHGGRINYPDRNQFVDDSESETVRFERYLREATEAAERACREHRHGTTETTPLPTKADALRWFILASEVSAWMDSGQEPPEQESNSLPFSVWVQARHSGAPISSAVAASSEPTVPSTAQPAVEDAPDASNGGVSASESANQSAQLQTKLSSKKAPSMFAVPTAKLMRKVVMGIQDHDMIRPGDRVMLGLSGGKDSLSLLHFLVYFRKNARFHFDLAACTVDPQTEGVFDASMPINARVG